MIRGLEQRDGDASSIDDGDLAGRIFRTSALDQFEPERVTEQHQRGVDFRHQHLDSDQYWGRDHD